MSTKILFACSKCFSRHPFEELSAGQQLCKDCRGSYPIVKCTYCRTEFQQTSRSSTSAICKRCEQNIKQNRKPSACECCNIIAAFFGNKCQRCASSEAKYGPAVPCDQCKQRSAFDRRDEKKKIDGKLLCWLCTCSYKRALAKARQVERDSSRLNTKKRPHTDKERAKENSSTKKLHRDITKQSSNKVEVPEKSSSSRPVVNNTNTFAAAVTIDPNSSDHVVAMTTLKEQIASLQRRLNQKDKELLEKDKLITVLKGKNFDKENEMRTKMKDMERLYELKVDLLNKKVSSLLREVASLSKQNANKKNGSANFRLEIKKEKEKERVRDIEREKEKERDKIAEMEIEKEKNEESDKEEDKDEKVIKDEKSDKDEMEEQDDRSDSEKNDKNDKELDEDKEDSENEEQDEKDDRDDKDDDSSDDSRSRSGSPASN